MTPAERALLLAVAKYMVGYVGNHVSAYGTRALDELIAAVEVEDVSRDVGLPGNDARSCETCGRDTAHEDPCLWASQAICVQPDKRKWQPKPSEASECQTCSGKGMTIWNNTADECPDCGGTGRKR